MGDYDSDTGGGGRRRKGRKGKRGKRGRKGKKGIIKQRGKMKAASREYKKIPKSKRKKGTWDRIVKKHLNK